MRILHVDDDASIRELVYLSLVEIAGFEVLQFSDGPSAIQQVNEFQPDVLLLDYSMPGMTGAETLIEIRNQAGFATIPSIFLTALDNDEMMIRLLELGVLQVIPKPVNFMELPSLIEGALLKSREPYL